MFIANHEDESGQEGKSAEVFACVPVAGGLPAMGVRLSVPALPGGQRRACQAVPQCVPTGGAAVPLLLAGGPLSFLPHTVRRRAYLPVPRCVLGNHTQT